MKKPVDEAAAAGHLEDGAQKAGDAARPARGNVVLRIQFVGDRTAKALVGALHGGAALAVALLAWETAAKLSHPVSLDRVC